jgi:hypothetical protein
MAAQQFRRYSNGTECSTPDRKEIPASKGGMAWRFKREKIDRWMEAKEKRRRK